MSSLEDIFKRLKEKGYISFNHGEGILFYKNRKFFTFSGDEEDFFDAFDGDFEFCLQNGHIREINEEEAKKIICFMAGLETLSDGFINKISEYLVDFLSTVEATK